jgi:hypothetical protein
VSSAADRVPESVTAGDVLLPGLSVASGRVDGTTDFLYAADLTNESDRALSVAYPIELRGPGGVTVPTGFAMLLERKTADRYLGFPTGALHPLTRVLPRQPVTMLLRCASTAAMRPPRSAGPKACPQS